MQRSGYVLEHGLLVNQRYRVERLLGRGGMGEVYLATDTLLSEDLEASHVALKVLRTDLGEDESYRKRFLREVAVTRSITHPNVVRTFDVGHADDLLFFTMEYVEGQSLDSWLAGEPLEYASAASVLAQITLGLSAIHAAGVVHRDLKPSNLIINAAGEVKITDFGVARSANSSLTSTHEVIGSLYYLPPEAWKGEDITAQSDVYSLGVLAYELLTGVVPFDGTAAPEIMCKHLETTPVAPIFLAATVPGWMSELVVAMLEKDPEARPSTEHILRRLEGSSSSVEIHVEELREDPLQNRVGGCVLEEFLESRGELAPATHAPQVPSSLDTRGNVPMVDYARSPRQGFGWLSFAVRSAIAAITLLIISRAVLGVAAHLSETQLASFAAKGGAPFMAFLAVVAVCYCWGLVSPVFVIIASVRDFSAAALAWLQAGMKLFLVALILYTTLFISVLQQGRAQGTVMPTRISAAQAFEIGATRLVHVGLLSPTVDGALMASTKFTPVPLELRAAVLPTPVLHLMCLGIFLPTLAWGVMAALRPFASIRFKIAGALGLGVLPVVAGGVLWSWYLTPTVVSRVAELKVAVGPLSHAIHPWVLGWTAGYWALVWLVALLLKRKS